MLRIYFILLIIAYISELNYYFGVKKTLGGIAT